MSTYHLILFDVGRVFVIAGGLEAIDRRLRRYHGKPPTQKIKTIYQLNESSAISMNLLEENGLDESCRRSTLLALKQRLYI